MKDFSHWIEYEGASEGSGTSEKIWLKNPETNEIGLFKYKKDIFTTDHISECLSYQLAKLIDIPCAKFEIGKYFKREGSMSYNIIEKPKQALVEGISFITNKYPQYDPEKFVDRISGDRYSLEMIENVMSEYGIFYDFLKIPIFDYLIGNSDRHQSNWAVIVDDGEIRWSPLYDNSSSLCAYVPEEKINGYLGKDKTRWKSLVETKSKSLIRRTVSDEKKPTHLEMLKFIKSKYYDETKKDIDKIIEVVTEKEISSILEKYEDNVLSENKKILIKRFLMSKIEKMKEVYSGKES